MASEEVRHCIRNRLGLLDVQQTGAAADRTPRRWAPRERQLEQPERGDSFRLAQGQLGGDGGAAGVPGDVGACNTEVIEERRPRPPRDRPRWVMSPPRDAVDWGSFPTREA